MGWIPRSRALRALRKLTQTLPTQGNDIDVYHDSVELYARMLLDIARATTRISMEMYLFRNDDVGRDFSRALCERAGAGLEVRIVLDSVGSLGPISPLIKDLREAGAEVLMYHPLRFLRPQVTLLRRNHRKTLIVDGRIGYAGGVNIGTQWLPHEKGGAAWRDTMVRVTGPAAGDLEVLFEETWYTETGTLLELPRALPREGDDADSDDDCSAQVYVVAGRGTRRQEIQRHFLIALAHARQEICITSSYFIPDFRLRKALYRARRRGVKVTLLLPGLTDVPATLWASRYYFHRFLERGIRIFEWTETVLHAKTIVVDDELSCAGSSNIDHFSLHRNLEANLVIFDEATARTLRDQFREDLARSHEITLPAWRTRGWWSRAKEILAHLVERLL